MSILKNKRLFLRASIGRVDVRRGGKKVEEKKEEKEKEEKEEQPKWRFFLPAWVQQWMSPFFFLGRDAKEKKGDGGGA